MVFERQVSHETQAGAITANAPKWLYSSESARMGREGREGLVQSACCSSSCLAILLVSVQRCWFSPEECVLKKPLGVYFLLGLQHSSVRNQAATP